MPAPTAPTTARTAESFAFRPATRRRSLVRAAIVGPGDSGKTLTALKFAREIAGPDGVVGVIDTENHTAEMYSGPGFEEELGQWQHANLVEDYSPESYIAGIEAAAAAGVNVLVIDTITPEWDGAHGCLEEVDRLKAANTSRNANFDAWATVTPRHRAFLKAIIHAPMHVIVTVRMKEAHEITRANGETSVVKLGLQPIQREQWDQDFHLVVTMDAGNVGTVTKAGKWPALKGSVWPQPAGQHLRPYLDWLSEGVAPKTPADFRRDLLDNRGDFAALREVWGDVQHAGMAHRMVPGPDGTDGEFSLEDMATQLAREARKAAQTTAA